MSDNVKDTNSSSTEGNTDDTNEVVTPPLNDGDDNGNDKGGATTPSTHEDESDKSDKELTTDQILEEVEKWKSLSRKNEEGLKDFRAKYEQENQKLESLTAEASEKDQTIQTLSGELSEFKKTSILKEYSIPEEWEEFVTADSFDEMKRKAEKLSKSFKNDNKEGHTFVPSSGASGIQSAKTFSDAIKAARQQSN